MAWASPAESSRSPAAPSALSLVRSSPLYIAWKKKAGLLRFGETLKTIAGRNTTACPRRDESSSKPNPSAGDAFPGPSPKLWKLSNVVGVEHAVCCKDQKF